MIINYRKSIVLFAASIAAVFNSAGLHAQEIPGTEVASLQELFDITPTAEARAAYNPLTGNVFVSIGSSDVLVFDLGNSDSNADFNIVFNLANLDQETLLGEFDLIEPDLLGNLEFSGFTPGVYDLGQLLPVTDVTTAEEFADANPSFLFRSGVPGVPEVRSRLNILVAVPEPNSLFALSALCGIAVTVRRR